MQKLFIFAVSLLLALNLAVVKAAPFESENLVEQSKVTVVVLLDPLFQQNTKALDIIKAGLREKFGQADIVYFGGSQAKSPEFLEFIEKVQTDPLNDKGIIWINEQYLYKLGHDTNSKYVLLINLSVTGYNGYYDYWSNLMLTAYNVETEKPIAINGWRKGKTKWATQGADYYIAKLKNEFKWPVESAPTERIPNDTMKPAVAVFLPEDIFEMPELVQKIRNAVASKFKINSVPIYIDNMPKDPDFLNLVNKVMIDSAKQDTTIVRKDYLVEYGKHVNANQVIAIKISLSEYDMNIWSGKSIYRFNEEILVVDTMANKYISSVAYDTGDRRGRPEGIEFVINKLQNEFVFP